MADQLLELDENQQPRWSPHRYQWQTMFSLADETYNLKGWRAGFSSWAPKWLMDEMIRCGPGNPALNYAVAVPSLASGKDALIAQVLRVFVTYYNICTHNKNDNIFWTTPEGERMLWGHVQKERTPIRCVYLENPESFGSMTSIAIVGDEVGQKRVKLEAYRTLKSRLTTQRGRIAPGNRDPRLSVNGTPIFPRNHKCGRILAGSTVWNLGWMQDQYDEWWRAVKDAGKVYAARIERMTDPADRAVLKQDFYDRYYTGQLHPRMHFIRYDSTANPTFPRDEWVQLRQNLPDWFFDMRYRALFRKPAGVIFDAWEPNRHAWAETEKWNPATLPDSWPRRLSVDFGQKNFRALFIAYDPEQDRHIPYHIYRDSQLTNPERAREILKIEPRIEWCVAGQISEERDRVELAAGGLHAIPPQFKDMWSQIVVCAGAIKNDKIFVFSGACAELCDELKNFSRPVDDKGEVDLDADPEDHETYHCLATIRYYASWWLNGYANTGSANAMAGGRRPAATPDAAPAPRLDTVIAPTVMAGGGMSRAGRARASRYGLDAGCYEPYLDIDVG